MTLEQKGANPSQVRQSPSSLPLAPPRNPAVSLALWRSSPDGAGVAPLLQTQSPTEVSGRGNAWTPQPSISVHKQPQQKVEGESQFSRLRSFKTSLPGADPRTPTPKQPQLRKPSSTPPEALPEIQGFWGMVLKWDAGERAPDRETEAGPSGPEWGVVVESGCLFTRRLPSAAQSLQNPSRRPWLGRTGVGVPSTDSA